MKDYKYEMLERTTKIRVLSGEIHQLSEEILKDNTLSTSEKWELIAPAQRYICQQNCSIPNFDIDVFQRFNTDYEVLRQAWRKYGIEGDSLTSNFITARLIEDEAYEHREIVFAYDFLGKLTAIKEMYPESLMFSTTKYVIKTGLDGEEYEDEIEDVIILTNGDLDLAKEWFMKEGIYLFKFQSPE